MFMYLWAENEVSEEIRAKLVKSVKCPLVYMFLGKGDKVLYVGKTTQFCSRWSQHVRGDKPMLEVKRVVLYLYDSVSDAAFQESQYIIYNQPPWNTQGKNCEPSPRGIQPSAYVELKVLTKHLNTFLQGLYS